jgi:hypothetical protein
VKRKSSACRKAKRSARSSSAAGEITNPDDAVDIASASTVAATVRLARADRRHAATADQWDADLSLILTGGPEGMTVTLHAATAPSLRTAAGEVVSRDSVQIGLQLLVSGGYTVKKAAP